MGIPATARTDPHALLPRCLLAGGGRFYLRPLAFAESCAPKGISRRFSLSVRKYVAPAHTAPRSHTLVTSSRNVVPTPSMGKTPENNRLEQQNNSLRLTPNNRCFVLVGQCYCKVDVSTVYCTLPGAEAVAATHRPLNNAHHCGEQQQQQPRRSCATSQGVTVCFVAVVSTENGNNNNMKHTHRIRNQLGRGFLEASLQLVQKYCRL